MPSFNYKLVVPSGFKLANGKRVSVPSKALTGLGISQPNLIYLLSYKLFISYFL